MEAIDGNAREKAIAVGANVVMPNITPTSYRPGYLLYENKPLPVANDNGEGELKSLERRLRNLDHVIAYFQQGNSARYEKRIQTGTSIRI
jgi:biotin synthase